MTLLLGLYLGHLVGDFVLQPGALVVAKRKRAGFLLLHGVIVGVATAAVLVADIAVLWPIVLLDIAAHMAIEIITVRVRGASRGLGGLGALLVDQGLHILSLVTLVWFVARRFDVEHVGVFGLHPSGAMIAVICGIVAVAFMGAILVFEVGNEFGPDSQARAVLPLDLARGLGMVERTTAFLLALAVGPFAVLAPFVPRTAALLRLRGDERYSQLLEVGTGLAVCLAAWLLVRQVVGSDITSNW